MSANIYYQPVETNRHDVYATAPSSFMAAMEKVFGFPCELDEKSVSQLEAMAAASQWGDDHNPYRDLIDGIEKYGRIRVFSEY